MTSMTAPSLQLKACGRSLDLSTPQIMGILNVTPDSFSDGGRFNRPEAALQQAHFMVEHGASVIDIGGESTRPGADPVSTEEELSRTVPVVERIAKELDVMISIDTSNPVVMEECCKAGAHLWNDIRALQRPDAVATAKRLGVGVCLMHMQGKPKTMQETYHYESVTKEVTSFLLERVRICEEAGIASDKIMLDPGFGFGKSVEENYSLLAFIPELVKLGYPVLSALSRKSMIGAVTHQEIPAERMSGSVAGAFYSFMQGAHMVRVHDVKETWEALQVFKAVHAAEQRL